MVEVKMNLGDYITAYADEEDELLSNKTQEYIKKMIDGRNKLVENVFNYEIKIDRYY